MSMCVSLDGSLGIGTSETSIPISRASSGGVIGNRESSGSSIGGVGRKERSSPSSTISNTRISLTRLSEEKRARRCRFYRNGDQWFPGLIVAVAGDKHRTWAALLEDLTRLLDHPQHLASGVRYLFTITGSKVSSLESLGENGEYVASSIDSFKNIDYHKARLPQWRIHARRKEALHVNQTHNQAGVPSSVFYSPHGVTSRLSSDSISHDLFKAKIITVIRNGIRPRKAIRILLNRKTARSFEQVLNDITESIRLDSGAVRKVFTLSGTQITTLREFFLEDDVFVAYGTERYYQDDFEIDSDEYKTIEPLVKYSFSPNRRRRMPSPQPRGRAISPLAYFDGPSGKTGSLPRSPRKSRYSTHKQANIPLPIPKQNGNYQSDIPEEIYPFEVQSKYLVGPILGDGNFAVVHKCTSKATDDNYALKIIHKAKCRGKEQMIESEVSILRRVSHPNIVSLIEEFESKEYLYLVMELVTGGDLFDAIATATKFTEYDARIMLSDLASSLHYLHQMNIVHRDIKPENLLVQISSCGQKSLKLGDFGLAVEVIEPLYTVCGTPTYVAPEILQEAGYGLKVDIWAAGVITYILLCGFPPFVSATNKQEELFDQILHGFFEFHSPYWDHISMSAKELIVCMIQVDQERRYTAYQVLQHPWTQLPSQINGDANSERSTDNIGSINNNGNGSTHSDS